MKTYTVFEIAKLLDVNAETVRRWIRSGKLKATLTARKTGHVIFEKELIKFLQRIPKYANRARKYLRIPEPKMRKTEVRMKVYERNKSISFITYPVEMEKILKYLNKHGKILVTATMIEQLYRDFSEEYYCAGWMSVDDDILAEFEEWLTTVEC